MPKSDPNPGIAQKALAVNLDEAIYGTIVEIGAGQEVARQFFSAGGAAGSIAKTMSAYDMNVSDEIYGAADRYVSRERLEQMLAKEYELLVRRLVDVRPRNSTFFAYAATVAAKAYKGNSECHGWVGIRAQPQPAETPYEIVMHVRMLDDDSHAQSEALGMLGVNLIHGAFFHQQNPELIIDSLLDNIGQGRLEIDLINFSGPTFHHVENRLMNLRLIRSWLTRAVMFDDRGQSVAPIDMLYKKPVQVIRGSFKPLHNVHLDMLASVHDQFLETTGVRTDDVVQLAEITISELASENQVDDGDFLARVDLLNGQGLPVLISDYVRFFRLRSWLRHFTQNPICICISVLDFDTVFDDQYYAGLEGGILEAIGKLFPDNTHVFVYPSRQAGELITLENVSVPESQIHLLKYLLANNKMIPVRHYVAENLHISAREIARQIPLGRGPWEDCVPEQVAKLIRERHLFDYPGD
ncbi:MAG: TonB-dependent receptor [Pseudomonadota bacterium]